jgi:hypothetical protein
MIVPCPTREVLGCPRRWLRLPFGLGYLRIPMRNTAEFPYARRGCSQSRWLSVNSWRMLKEAASVERQIANGDLIRGRGIVYMPKEDA